jgi:hypothetical protein
MEVIKWDCGEQSEQLLKNSFLDNEIQKYKEQLVAYKSLLDAKQISEFMYIQGELEIKKLITNLIINSIESYYNKSDECFDFPADVLSAADKPIGFINMLCPECNGFTEDWNETEHFEHLNIRRNIIIKDIDRVGTRMQLINGKFGKFWGCTNYPNCKCTVSTLENLKQKRKHFNSLNASSIYDYDDDATDYMPDIF